MTIKHKEGAVDNKKKYKWCAETNQWIPFSKWKKHKAQLAEQTKVQQYNTVDKVVPVASWQSLVERNKEFEKLREDRDNLLRKVQRLEQENKALKQLAYHTGRLLMASYEY